MKNIFPFVYLILISCSMFGQEKDYTEIKFKSKLRNYTKVQPKTKELGMTKEIFSQMVELLAKDVYSESEKTDYANKLWLAISNPQKFDYVYKFFSLSTIKNWGVKIKFEDPIYEPNPYLEKWTNTGDEYLYFQWATTQILTKIGLLTYGEDGRDAQNGMKNLKLVPKEAKYPLALANQYTYDYLSNVSASLHRKGLTILIYNNHYDFTVCKIEDKEKLISLFEKLQWEFVDL